MRKLGEVFFVEWILIIYINVTFISLEQLCVFPLLVRYSLFSLALHFRLLSVTHSLSSLTLRLLMSYIYMEHLFLMFLDHTQRRTTVGRTPLDE